MSAITLLQPFNLDTTKDFTFANVSASNIKADHLLYANGTAWPLALVSGSNTYVQFNDGGIQGSSSSFTFDKTTGTLTITNITANGSGLTSLTGANVTGQVSYANTANNVAGANVSGAVSYATTANSVAGANVSGAVSYATTANSVAGANVSGEVSFAATANSVAGANVSGQVSNALVAGTVYTASQPNITSVGTLTSLSISGDTTVTGNLTVTGTTITANVTSIVVKDPIIEQGGNTTGALSTNDGKDRGQLLHYYVSGTTNAPVDAFMGWNTANGEFRFGSNVSLTSEVVTFNSYGNLRANVYFGNGSGLTSLTGANVSGEVSFAATANSVAGANVSGQVAYANIANNVAGANVSGQVSYANTANNVAGANVSGAVSYATTANSVAGANVSGAVSYATTANSVAGANVSGAVGLATYATTANAVAGANVSGEVSFAATANSVAGANVTGQVSYAATANSVAGSNVSGQVSNALVAGTVYTASQPNITSVGTLTSLTVSGSTDLGSVSNVKITGGTANYVLRTDGAGNLTWQAQQTIGGSATQIQYNDGTNLAGSANLTFNATSKTLTVDNIVANGSGLTSLTGANVTGQVSYAAIANSVAGANVTGTVANATYAITAGTAYSVDGANVSGAVAYATTANSVAGANVSGSVSLAYKLANGTSNVNIPTSGGNVTVGVAGNAGIITVTGTGVNVSGYATVSGNITADNANLGNAVTANYFIGSGANLTSIAGANVTGTVANATYAITAGTAYSVAGGNVVGYVADATHATVADSANSVAGANVTGQVSNALVSGTVYTASQPNITSVGTLTSLTVTGNVTGGNLKTTGTLEAGDTTITGNLTVSGAFEYANVTSFKVKDTIIEQGGNTAGGALTSNDGFDRGQLLHYYKGGAIDAFMGWKTSSDEFIFASNASESSGNIAVNTYGNVHVGYIIGNGSSLTSLTGSNVTGAVAYATTANSVAGSNVSGAVSYATTANSVAGANVSGAVAYATTANSVAGANVSGEVSFAATANSVAGANVSGAVGLATYATTANSVAGANVSGQVSYANIANNVAGANVSGEVSFAATANSVAGANVTGQVSNALVSGTVYTANQPNITSVGTLTSLAVTGNTALTGANVSLGAISNLHITGGTSNYVLKTDGSGNLSWTAQTQTASILVDNFTGNGVQTIYALSSTPANVNSVLVNINGASQLRESYSLSGADLVFGSPPPNTAKVEVTILGLTTPGASGFSYFEVTSNASATARNKYIVNTNSANLTVTLPNAPSLGDEIGVIDGTGNASVHAITIDKNGQKINGSTSNYTISTNRGIVNLVYYNSTQGWLTL